MGFETRREQRECDHQRHYEISLWDLKPLSSQSSQGCHTHYEISLWDLKHPDNHVAYVASWLWDIPMGFETYAFGNKRMKVFIMRYPYGIWNSSSEISKVATGSIMRYPYGIWNLYALEARGVTKILWDIPMGFETPFQSADNGHIRILWDIPMGFETILIDTCNILHRQLWDIPMGFETTGILLANTLKHDYEISLWDLKRVCHSLWVTGCLIMRYPYGIWNLFQVCLQTCFETHYEISLWDLKLHKGIVCALLDCIMRYPYGIWNVTRHLKSLTTERLWDIPMGFETHK